jgi:hypothetical protein
MAGSEVTRWLSLVAIALLPVGALAQSASEVERCFQNPSACSRGPAEAPRPATAGQNTPAPAPDYATVLNSPEVDRKRVQESLRVLDKYTGPIDGNLQSEQSQKAIAEWQKGHGYQQVGKLTPAEAQTLHAEAAKAPIKRIDPSQTATAPPVSIAPAPSNADSLKSLQARLAERRKVAEPKAEAAAQSLVKDLKAYVAADGKGVVGEQFASFAKWYADNKAAGRAIGDVTPAIDDYGDARSGAATTAEVRFETRQGDKTYSQCLVFAWIEANPRKNGEAFSCDDVASVEKWKTDQALRSAWR